MQILESSIEEANHVLRESTRGELREVERTLRRLSREQILFVRDTLESARRDERTPPHFISFMEYLLQEWWEHSLATKLTVITRIVGLSDLGSWPGNTVGDRILNERVENLLGATLG
jgi:hypothetical protein